MRVMLLKLVVVASAILFMFGLHALLLQMGL